MHEHRAQPAQSAWAHSLLDGLTVEQRAAVTHPGGPLLIFAGPGSGKTKTITHRIAFLVATGQARPAAILAVTFTVRAAAEMRLRLIDLLGAHRVAGLEVRTFHGLCARILRTHAALIARSDEFTIYDEHETAKVIDTCLRDGGHPDVAAAVARSGQPGAGEIAREISLAKNRLWTPELYETRSPFACAATVAAVWRALDRELAACNALTFDDLLVQTARLLSEHPHIRHGYRRRFGQVLVDEYQDTNPAQAVLLSLLCPPAGNLTVVGDDDQAIYRFRLADVSNILGFAAQRPGCRTIVLSRNYRCRAEILAAAAACVSHNRSRAAKALIAVRGPGGSTHAIGFANDGEEAGWVADTIAWYLAAGIAASEILVLARNMGRAHHYLRPLERALHERHIPHRILGTLGLYERKEVRDALAYLALLANPYDAGALRRALAFPPRGAGPKTTEGLIAHARQAGVDLLDACRHAHELDVVRSGTVRAQVALLGSELTRVRAQAAGRSLAHVAAQALMVSAGPVRHLQHRRDHSTNRQERQDAARILEDLRSLISAANAYERAHPDDATLSGLLEHAAGLTGCEITDSDTRLTISTIHRAKGAEAQVVFVVGCEDGQLPSWRALESGDPEELCEERRLFYVAATRAKDRLYLCHCARRAERPTNGPSRFLTEALSPAPRADAA